jgi:hypothetical protein
MGTSFFGLLIQKLPELLMPDYSRPDGLLPAVSGGPMSPGFLSAKDRPLREAQQSLEHVGSSAL